MYWPASDSLRSRASAAREKRWRQRVLPMNWRSVIMRVGRMEERGEGERERRRSRRRRPRG
jgi:hypothetical protein